jgi:hypothetical protein
MGHAMNPIEKNVSFMFIYLVTLVFVPWNVLAPSNQNKGTSKPQKLNSNIYPFTTTP